MQVAATSKKARRKPPSHRHAVFQTKHAEDVSQQHSDPDNASAAQQVQRAIAQTLKQGKQVCSCDCLSVFKQDTHLSLTRVHASAAQAVQQVVALTSCMTDTFTITVLSCMVI